MQKGLKEKKALDAKFRDSAIEHPCSTAVQCKKNNTWRNVSFADLKGMVDSLSVFLSGRLVKKGERAAILLENRLEWPVIFFGVISAGAVCVPVNPEAPRKEIENILADSECKITFVKDAARHPFIKNAVSVDSKEFKKIFEKPPAKIKYEESNAGDTACILYTSGTTGAPKGVMLSHGNLASNSESLHKLNIITGKDCMVSILPLHHAYPLTVTMILPLLYGAKILYPGTIGGEGLLEALQEASPSIFVAVPQIFYSFHKAITEKLAKIPKKLKFLLGVVLELLYRIRNITGINMARIVFVSFHRKFGKSMRLFVSGGAKLNEKVERDLFKFGFTIIEGFGLTETSPVLTLDPPKRPKIGSAGKAVPGVEIAISGKNEKGEGEIIARGPNIMKGYYKQEDLTAGVIKDGWFHTGDLGYLDRNGYLFITGRSKDVIVLSSGLNVYPEEVEEAYLRSVPIKELCVFEAPAKKGIKEREILWAVVVPDMEYFKRRSEINLRDALKWKIETVSKTLPAYDRIMGFTITLEALPRTLLGKIKRFAVKERFSALTAKEEEYISSKSSKLSEADKFLMEKPLSKKIIDYLEKQTGLENIHPDDLLELDLGIDSLKRIELVVGFERLFGIVIADEVASKMFTVRELMGTIEKSPPGKTKREAIPGAEDGPDFVDWKKLLSVPPKDENLKKIDLKPDAWALLFSGIFAPFFYVILKLFSNVKVEGLKNIPREGSYLLFANHTSFFDAPLIVTSLNNEQRKDLFFVGFRVYFDAPVVRHIMKVRTARLIPLDFSSHFLEALRSSYYVLKNGKNLCIFPEGMRTFEGKIIKFKKGFGILAREAGAKIVPVFIDGAFEAWPRTHFFPRRHPLKVKFGKPLDLATIEKRGFEMGGTEVYEAICLATREALIKLGKSNGSDMGKGELG